MREPEVVRRAAAAEGDAVVGGALRVDEQVAPSVIVSRPRQPTSSQNACGSGSVAIISE